MNLVLTLEKRKKLPRWRKFATCVQTTQTNLKRQLQPDLQGFENLEGFGNPQSIRPR